MYKLIITENPSVAQNIAAALGIKTRKDGYIEGTGYLISWCVGHLAELAAPEIYDERYSKWTHTNLPIIPSNWRYGRLEKYTELPWKTPEQKRCRKTLSAMA